MDPIDVLEYLWQHPIRTVSLARYRRWFRGTPRPTEAQVRDFVEYVCEAHSWYKHLPLMHPGHRFTFFLDPGAGMALRDLPLGFSTRRPALKSDQWHYSHMDTETWRERFGLLSFREHPAPTHAPIVYGRGRRNRIPAEVDEAGSTNLNGLVHRYAVVWLEHHLNGNERDAERGTGPDDWPTESGGAAALEALRNRLDALDAEHGPRIELLARKRDEEWQAAVQASQLARHEAIDAVVAPERIRQQDAACRVIDQMLDIVLG